jgi:hypothetical protein
MFRRIRLIAGVVVLTIPLAYASERAAERPREDVRSEMAAETAVTPTLLRSDLASIFAPPEQNETIETDDGFMAIGGSMQVLVARIGADGKPVLGCVDTEDAARRFFDAPVERLPAGRRMEK